MSLARYKEKRSRNKTPEPFSGKGTGTELRFVVQKHATSHLHYDFRLEMGGVLKSWAVPKGPSVDPDVKRLAMMVEDHPYDYRNFEGIIPNGQYGGGTVIVWDEGTYEPAEPVAGDIKKQEKHLLHQLYSGKIKFTLHGKKLKGEFALVKAPARGENSWLLMKLQDRYAKKEDITLKDKSVISKKTIEQVAKTSNNIYGQSHSKKATGRKNKTVVEPAAEKKVANEIKRRSTSIKSASKQLNALLKKAGKQPFYTRVAPALATLVDSAFDEEGWLYEVKWDGYRAIAFMNKKTVELKSRNDKSFNEKFYPVYQALKDWGIDAVVDGEIVVVGSNGQSDFEALQNWRSEDDGILLYYLFDILWYKGYDLKGLELSERKAILNEIAPPDGLIKISDDFETSGIEFLEAARKMGLEGIIAKRKNSQYLPGERTRDWLKIKVNKRQEVVIGGYTTNEGTTKPFSSLLVGVFDKGKFVYTGKIGTGFNLKKQKEMLELFKPLVIKKPAFSEVPDINKPSRFRPNPPMATATWLKPELVCEVSFAEMTSDGVMRHPSFEGLREDKKASEVVLEKETDVNTIVAGEKAGNPYIKPVSKGSRKTLLNPKDETQVRKVGGHELKFTNLSKVFWQKEKITKRDLINYYYQAAPFILPYLKDRPQAMNRFPNGIEGKSFYYKNVSGKVPDWMDTYGYHSDTDGEDKEYLLGNNEATLLFMANQGCIEMNPWSSTTKKPDHPSWCMIDFDPDKNTFEQVIEAAQITHQILEDIGVPSYPKTSGSTGLHVYIPLGAKYTYEQSKEFARIIVTLVHREIPGYTSLERTVRDRKGKMYLDFLQNRPHATIAAPYAVRPKPGATVSMPLHWDEVKKGLKMTDFTIKNAIARMESEGDIFKPVLGKGIDMQKVLKKLEAMR
ncbi:bifunctional non-homologous end joining protein LigD [Chitinophaga terrae (ex Kim and Jung 2007)]|uniref:DNA ligase (ATP) n=1 Tax=Chitinophaga terrae (ex Kim and Jung 2007) TaxID=408074 RepID=A0A1H4F4Y4_9BACT|nr:DNA ligase D [Chitinophaga terrae (ex Kim and Jung 2007)]SEA92010.1 bifunctional non-homologous end joining protein LigD [Chitinophaga terrae (ex Kim and Jung 2007)]